MCNDGWMNERVDRWMDRWPDRCVSVHRWLGR